MRRIRWWGIVFVVGVTTVVFTLTQRSQSISEAAAGDEDIATFLQRIGRSGHSRGQRWPGGELPSRHLELTHRKLISDVDRMDRFLVVVTATG